MGVVRATVRGPSTVWSCDATEAFVVSHESGFRPVSHFGARAPSVFIFPISPVRIREFSPWFPFPPFLASHLESLARARDDVVMVSLKKNTSIGNDYVTLLKNIIRSTIISLVKKSSFDDLNLATQSLITSERGGGSRKEPFDSRHQIQKRNGRGGV